MPAIQFMASSTETTPVTGVSGSKTQKLQGLQSAFTNYMKQNSSFGQTAQAAKGQNAVPQAKASGGDSSVKQQYEQYQSKSAAQAEKVTGADSSQADSGTVKEAVEEAVQEIKESIKENLGVDEEQLEAAMELLGLTQADLLDPQQLVALAVELTGSEDAGMMLFTDNFQVVMQETSAITDGLLQELGMSMEQLMTHVQEAMENVEQPIETMLPDEQAADTPVQEAPQQTVTAQEVQQAPQAAVQPQETPRTEAVQTNQAQQAQPQEDAKTAQDAQQAVSVSEAQPQEEKQVQQAQNQPQQENEQDAQQQTAQAQPQDALKTAKEPQEQTRFDFHANVQQQEPAVNVQAPQNLSSEAPLPQINMQDVIDQIVEYTRVNLSEDVKSIEMQLNPANLGKVYLHVSEKQGAVTAQLTAQNENIKEALVQQAAILKDNLNQQGIKVDAVEVSVGAHEFESNLERDAHSQEEQARQQEENNRRHSRRSIHLGDGDSLDGISGLMSEEEALVARIMRDNGNNVDFKA
ncbi:MAG: flagellar hook-length control protein FliK [Eubacterium sp.]|nr:flagellar hook-length control protein FliK [Eubacterium sp.]